jgi:hypothetical protein
MSWYAETSPKRTRQHVADALVALWVLLWLWVGNAVHDAVQLLAVPGRELEEAGNGLASGLTRAAERADDLPVAGGALRSPLDAAADAGSGLAGAGVAQQEAVATLALVLAVVLAGLPIGLALLVWLPRRLRWAGNARAAVTLRDDLDLLALRAAATQPLTALAALGPEPVGRWRRGDAGAAQQLAALELSRLGLRPPAPPDPAAPASTR